MRRPRDRRVNSLLRDFRERDDDLMAENRAFFQKGYEKALKNRTVVGAGVWACLESLGQFYYDLRGCKRVAEGNFIDGWRDIERSTYYGAMRLSILEPKLLQSYTGECAGRLLGHSVLLEWWDIAERMARIVVDNSKAWPCALFQSFAVEMWRRLRPDATMTGPSAPLGVYQKILDAWTDEAHLAEALLEAIEYHLQNTTMFEDSDNAFTDVWELAPLEIELIRKVRTAEGLSMPAIEHPLLDTPFAQIPGPPSRYRPEDDSLVQQALALTRELMPELGL